MPRARGPRTGVCSWSLRPHGPDDLADRIRACRLDAVQLALDPIRRGDWDERATMAALGMAGIATLSGMMAMEGEDYSTLESIRATGGIAPTRHWEANRAAAEANADLARRMGIRLVTFHAGFIPHARTDPARRDMLERLRILADTFYSRGIETGLETGQESAETLIDALNDLNHPHVGVNFDPANMILYGMLGGGDPVPALERLAPWVRQVHIKDAIPAPRPGAWGTEVVSGAGAVRWPEFFAVLRERLPGINLVIEREAGEARVADVLAASAHIDRMLEAWDLPHA